jgi:putative FmdB family regulatory protein
MPVYEYSCTKCGERFEQYRTVRARSASRCPVCGGRGQRIFRPVGIIFKGSGFHSTDYREPEGKGKSAAEQKERKPAAPTSEKKDKSD